MARSRFSPVHISLRPYGYCAGCGALIWLNMRLYRSGVNQLDSHYKPDPRGPKRPYIPCDSTTLKGDVVMKEVETMGMSFV